ncbi:MAG TPA: hypothetical protein VEA40_17930 [Ramlibacter sp.]|nr:hypothetical protein [Ramlibacter sp.]
MQALKTRLAVLALAALGAGTAAAQTVVVVPVETTPPPTVVVVPDTRSMGAAPAPMTRQGDPLASTTQASTSVRPDLFRSADGTPAALGGGTQIDRSAPMLTLPPAMTPEGRIDRGNAD